MKLLGPVLLLGAVVVVVGFLTGIFTTDGVPAGVPTGAPQGVTDGVQQTKGFAIGHWPLLVVAGVGATFAVTFWRRIGGFGRATLIGVGCIAFTAWILSR